MTKFSPDRAAFSRWYYKDDPTHICSFSRETVTWLAAAWSAELIKITADSTTWLSILNGEYPMLKAIILRKVRVKGEMALFRAFGRCFPG